MGRTAWCDTRVHQTRQTNAERLYRKIQSHLSPGGARHVRVYNFERGAGTNGKVAEGVQRRTATRCAGRHDSQRISIDPKPRNLYLWLVLKAGYLQIHL